LNNQHGTENSKNTIELFNFLPSVDQWVSFSKKENNWVTVKEVKVTKTEKQTKLGQVHKDRKEDIFIVI
jgi:hypothetical protein